MTYLCDNYSEAFIWVKYFIWLDNFVLLLPNPFWESSLIFFCRRRTPSRQHLLKTSMHRRLFSTRDTLRTLSSHVSFMGVGENPCVQHSWSSSSVKFDATADFEMEKNTFSFTASCSIMQQVCRSRAAVLPKAIISWWRSTERLCRADWELQPRPGEVSTAGVELLGWSLSFSKSTWMSYAYSNVIFSCPHPCLLHQDRWHLKKT